MSENNPENPYAKPVQPAEPAPVAPPAPYAQPVQPAPYGQQPGQYVQQPGGYAPAPATDPGKTMAIIAVILPFVGFSLVGLILGIIAKVKSKKAGYKNTLALVAIIISAVAIVVSIIGGIILIVFLGNLANEITQACQDGVGTVTVNGQIVDCTTVNP
ncbi:DUF4190 domain-containing protein [Arthrobacter sp. GMC3]|uniref:DUF4190 domain-containing protein n=1 Tax=Arthrobacter sp. GMC3 TaxID=2058894 RepID=UPI000CE2CDA7|nr:DUF4190 domain-containing protein [Arthrobacter sp. GMC3]